jgi:hypothetical protein
VAATPTACYYSLIRCCFRRIVVEFWWILVSLPARNSTASAVYDRFGPVDIDGAKGQWPISRLTSGMSGFGMAINPLR